MLKSKPPARSTARRGPRLRTLIPKVVVSLLAGCLAAPTAAGAARPAPLRVLVSAPVTDQARASMSPELWTKFVDAYVAATIIPFDGPDAPTLADCRTARADYLVLAPFDVRPRLPGMPNAAGRVAARTHLVVMNCITGATIVDQILAFDSDPPSNANAGDFESVPEITWAHAVPATLAKYPIVLERVAHITNLNAPFAFVDLGARANLSAGDALSDFATADRVNRVHPIVMTVTQVFEKYVQVTFSTISGDLPSVGDLVEPLAKGGAPGASR